MLVEMLQTGHDRALMRGQPGLLKMVSLWPFVFGVLEQVAQRLVCSARQCGRSRNDGADEGRIEAAATPIFIHDGLVLPDWLHLPCLGCRWRLILGLLWK